MTKQPMWLEIGRDDFVDAIRRLKPERVLKTVLKREIQIGFDRGEAVFNVNGAETRRAAKGKWPGYVSFNFGRALTYTEVLPATDPVRLEFIDDRLRIDSSRLAATWSKAPTT